MAAVLSAPNLQLPWSSTKRDDKRYWKIFIWLAVPCFIVSVAIPLINIPEPPREEKEKLPPQLARVVLKKKELPKPPPPKPKPEKKKEEKKKEPKKEKKKKPPKKEPEPAKLVKAKEAAQAEINTFMDELSNMRESFDLSEVNENLTQGTGAAAEVSRNVVTGKASGGSGGINTSALSSNTGGTALSGKQNAVVDSKLADAEAVAKKAKKARKKGSAGRSDEDIRIVMGRSKGAIDSIYRRALRKNPTLEGKFVVAITIEPSGRVSKVNVLSSDLDDPALEARLVNRIKLINFGASSAATTTVKYSIDFFPS